ncbi:pyruvate dehydrogenase E2 component (dihydrolipoamide acetyltransferase) [Phycisphaerales bacterium]|nr:pyruvate dehydrogenase E2 component (dihydrolipoamide acetyltransferase) [Phycisphaerales bacterium]
MPIEVTMPRLSDTMQQGTIVKWNVKEGQNVKSGDVIADIETDKATMELQAFDDGVVAALPVAAGQSVPVGTVIMVLAAKGEDAAAIKASAASASGAVKTAAASSAGSSGSAKPATGGGVAVAAPVPDAGAGNGHAPGGRVFASPLAKKIAEEAGVDLSRVTGSGPGGRIVRKDVEEALSGGVPAQPAARPAPSAARAPSAPATLGAAAALTGDLVPLSNMRRIIATRLVESKTTIPHYQVTVEVDMDSLLSLRKQLNEQLAAQGVKLSVNDFLVRACALAMHQHPFVNSRWVDQGNQVAIQQLADVNIGIAIALPMERGGGLVVGTVRSADNIGLRQISAESKRLGDKARAKGLTPEEMSDGTFVISNLGMFGVSHFTAIISPPNAAILAVGAAMERAVVKNGQIVVGNVMSMTMSSDHRIIDGAMAAQYLATVKDYLEKPATLLV